MKNYDETYPYSLDSDNAGISFEHNKLSNYHNNVDYASSTEDINYDSIVNNFDDLMSSENLVITCLPIFSVNGITYHIKDTMTQSEIREAINNVESVALFRPTTVGGVMKYKAMII